MGDNRSVSRPVVCTHWIWCTRYSSNPCECHCRYMGVWFVERKIATLSQLSTLQMIQPKERIEVLLKTVRMLTSLVVLSLVGMIFLLLAYLYDDAVIKFVSSLRHKKDFEHFSTKNPEEKFWSAPDINTVKDEALKAQISYGKEL